MDEKVYEKKMEKSIKLTFKCPHCGDETKEITLLKGEDKLPGQHTVTCDKCGKDYFTQINILKVENLI